MSLLWRVWLPLLIAYGLTLQWCWDIWQQPDGYWSHGPLVVALLAWLLWLWRRQWGAVAAGPDRRGARLLAVGLLVHLMGALLTVDSLSAASLLLVVPGAVWWTVGMARLRAMLPVLALVLFCVPLPLFATDVLAFQLKEFAMGLGLALANLFGADAVRDGAVLRVPGQSEGLLVADPCGGLRSLLAMITLAYCIAFFLGPERRSRRWLLFALAAPIAVLVNVVRIALAVLCAGWFGVAFAGGTGHDVLNVLAWVIDLGVLLLLNERWQRGEVASAREPVPAPVHGDVPVRAIRSWWPLWLLAPGLLWLCWYRPNVVSEGRGDRLPVVLGEFTQSEAFALTPRYRELLGTGDATWRAYRRGTGPELYVVAVFHGSNWKSVHPPHLCLKGSDMDIVSDRVLQPPGLGDGASVERIVTRARGSGRPYLSLTVYGADDLCTGSYAGFFLHHLPRALLRQSDRGFLLRVETFADDGEQAAEQRCLALLGALLPAAREVLR